MPSVRTLTHHFVQATEAAAVASAAWRGRGDRKAADGAAVAAMRRVFDRVPFDGRVAIGEGERDEAPMLWIGEPLGSLQGADGAPQVDIAVDPLECTNHVALDHPNAIAVLAAAPRGTLLHAPDCYMDKIAGGAALHGVVSLEQSPEDNARAAATALGKEVSELVVVIMDRPRHEDLIARLRTLDVRLQLIGDGDVVAAIKAADPTSDVDMLMGIGAAPEGVISATALRGLGGVFEGRLVFTTEDHRERAARMLDGGDLQRIWRRDDLCSSPNAVFVATGVISGWLRGVEFGTDEVTTHSYVIYVADSSRRHIIAHHPLNT